MNEFKTYHPIINFTYFVFAIGFSCFFMHPVCICTSFVCSLIYSIVSGGRNSSKKSLVYIVPVLVLTAIINPLFNHQGTTILWYFPSGNPLTLESIFYGFASSGMIISIILWFYCYNKIITSDKFIYLFGKLIPKLSLVFSMTLRFVPSFFIKLRAVADAQISLGRDVFRGSIIKRAKCGLDILSITTSWALENAIDTADSMKSRGYGLSGRTAFSNFTFDKRDKKAFFVLLALGLYTLIGNLAGAISFSYFPHFSKISLSAYSLSVFISYFIILIFPVIIEVWEAKKWKSLKSKI